MSSKPQPPPQPSLWDVYKVSPWVVAGLAPASAAKFRPLGTVEAADEADAIAKAAKEFRQHAAKLIAIKRI